MKTSTTSNLPSSTEEERRLTTDVEVLRENHPELYEELREVVGEPEENNTSSEGE